MAYTHIICGHRQNLQNQVLTWFHRPNSFYPLLIQNYLQGSEHSICNSFVTRSYRFIVFSEILLDIYCLLFFIVRFLDTSEDFFEFDYSLFSELQIFEWLLVLCGTCFEGLRLFCQFLVLFSDFYVVWKVFVKKNWLKFLQNSHSFLGHITSLQNNGCNI